MNLSLEVEGCGPQQDGHLKNEGQGASCLTRDIDLESEARCDSSAMRRITSCYIH